MTTPDKDEMPTDRTGAALGTEPTSSPCSVRQCPSNGGIIECDSPEVAAYIVTACNAHEPMREGAGTAHVRDPVSGSNGSDGRVRCLLSGAAIARANAALPPSL